MSEIFYRRFGKQIPELKLTGGLTLETGSGDPTVVLVKADKGSLYLDHDSGNTYQKFGDGDYEWVQLLDENTSLFVTSVNGETGVVTLDKNDIGLGNVDNTSDMNKPVSTATQTALNGKENTGVAASLDAAHISALDPHAQYQKESEKGAALGYASLDGGGKVPVAQLPSAVMTYEGVWNASTNSPTLADGTGDNGMVYRVNVAGTQNLGSGSQTFNIGDYVIYNGSVWEQSDTTDAVASVNGYTGVVALAKSDIGLSNVPNVDATSRSNHTGTQLASTISDFSSAAKSATVSDAIVDGTVDVAPSQNAVYDALALKANDSNTLHLSGIETATGYKTFQAGLKSSEEVIIASTINAYSSVRSPNLSGTTQVIKIVSGDSTSGDSGDVGLEVGAATPTAPAVLVIQGLSITEIGALGKAAGDGWVDIVVDNTNITNPTSPAFNTRGGGGQKLEIRVNSATTVNDVVAAFPSSGLTGAFSISGSGLTTFVNGSAPFVAGNDYGATYLKSDNRVRLETDVIQMGKSTASGQAVFQGLPRASGNSDNVFLLSGRVTGSGSSGGISIRSADMESTGGSGGTFVRTGSVNGATASGGTTISTGATTTYSTAASGNLGLTTGNIGGTAGNSGAVNMNSGNINSGTGTSGQVNILTGANNLSGGSGATGNATFRSGDMSGTNSGVTGLVTVRSGNKTNASATGNTGGLILNTGNNTGAGSSGSITMQSGTTTTAASGGLTINSGDTTSATNGTGSVTLKSGNKSTGTGTTGGLIVQSGSGGPNGSSGSAQIFSGGVQAGTSGNLFAGSGDATTGISGNATLRSGHATTAGGSTGTTLIQSGNVQAGSGNSGQANLISGSVVDGTSGIAQLKTGSASGTGSTGTLGVSTGNATSGNTGGTFINSGSVSSGSGTSGILSLVTGATVNGNSGSSFLQTGAVSGTGASGDIYINSGNVTSGTANSGSINLNAGTSAGGVKGKVNVQVIMNLSTLGAPASPADGDIWFDGTNLNIRVGGVTKTVTLV